MPTSSAPEITREDAIARLMSAQATLRQVRGSLARLGAYEPLLTATLCTEAEDRLRWIEGRIRNPDGLLRGASRGH